MMSKVGRRDKEAHEEDNTVEEKRHQVLPKYRTSMQKDAIFLVLDHSQHSLFFFRNLFNRLMRACILNKTNNERRSSSSKVLQNLKHKYPSPTLHALIIDDFRKCSSSSSTFSPNFFLPSSQGATSYLLLFSRPETLTKAGHYNLALSFLSPRSKKALAVPNGSFQLTIVPSCSQISIALSSSSVGIL